MTANGDSLTKKGKEYILRSKKELHDGNWGNNSPAAVFFGFILQNRHFIHYSVHSVQNAIRELQNSVVPGYFCNKEKP